MEHPGAIVFHILLLKVSYDINGPRIKVNNSRLLIRDITERKRQLRKLEFAYMISGSVLPTYPLLALMLIIDVFCPRLLCKAAVPLFSN